MMEPTRAKSVHAGVSNNQQQQREHKGASRRPCCAKWLSRRNDSGATSLSPDTDLSRAIITVAQVSSGFHTGKAVKTPVPDDTPDVPFNLAGHGTNAGQMQQVLGNPDGDADKPGVAPVEPPSLPPTNGAEQEIPVRRTADCDVGKPKRPIFILIGLAVIAAAALLVWYIALRDKGSVGPSPTPAIAAASQPGAAQPFAADESGLDDAMKALAAEARTAKLIPDAANALEAAANEVAALLAGTEKTDGSNSPSESIAALAKSAGVTFVGALVRDVESKSIRLGRDVPWTKPARSAAKDQPLANRRIFALLAQSRSRLLAAQRMSEVSGSSAEVVSAGRLALAEAVAFDRAMVSAYRAHQIAKERDAKSADTAAAIVQPAKVVDVAKPPAPSGITPPDGVSPDKIRKFNKVAQAAREIADRLIQMEKNADSSISVRNRRILRQNAQSARGYLSYLDKLSGLLKGAASDREADAFIKNARQTERYLKAMASRSKAAQR